MRIHMILFTIIIERANVASVEKSKRRSRQIEQKINDVKSKYTLI
ncbi:hypothetical protein [Halobacillus trueperi]|nr:hypothetical protein [Halobacillus trueperi]